MKLKKAQVGQIQRDLRAAGIRFDALQEDMVDHISTETEQLMDEGKTFAEAYHQALDKFGYGELLDTQNETLQALSPFFLLRSYLKTAYRNLLRHKRHSLTNIFGLSIGLSITILILIFVRYEASHDQQHPESNLYRLVTTLHERNGKTTATTLTGAPWAPVMVEELPELLGANRFMKYRLDVLVTTKEDNRGFYEPNLMWADPEALEFFDLPMIDGQASQALVRPNTVVISESMARKYFGNEPAIGKFLSYENRVDLEVTGVMRDMPDNMHFKADFLASFSTLKTFWSIIDNWTILYYYSYFKVQPGTDIAEIEAKLPTFFEKHIGPQWNDARSAHLQKVSDIHLYSHLDSELKSNTDINYLYLLGTVALVIVLLASMNFINLNVARSIERAKEVGIRKALGGLKKDLLVQFLIESALLVGVSLAIAVILSFIVLPYFKNLLGKELIILNPDNWSVMIPILISCGLITVISGLYPAMLASKVKMVNALKGKFESSISRFSIRDGLLVLQFTICIALLASIMIIKAQERYIFKKDVGYKKEQVILLPTGNLSTTMLPTVRNELLQIGEVSHVSITSHQLAGDQGYRGSYIFSGGDIQPDTLALGRLHIDEGFVNTYGINLISGRNFDASYSTDTSAFLVNETTLSLLGVTKEKALDLTITYLTQGENGRYLRKGRIIGVVQDFHMKSLHHEVRGLVMDIQLPRSHFIACRVQSDQYETTLLDIKNTMAQLAPNSPFRYDFLEDRFEQLYKNEKRLGTALSMATALSITIALLGLVGLVSQLASIKRREMGIRRVLGARSWAITMSLSQRYVVVGIIASLLATPISYWYMNAWLQNFSYSVDINWLTYPIAATLVLVCSLGTSVFIIIRTARVNPSKVLRYD